MTLAETWFAVLVPIAGLAVAGWLASVALKNVNLVDSLWSLFFLAAAVTAFVASPEPHARAVVLMVLVAAWALRLAAHLAVRNFGEQEDRRYRSMREKHGSAFTWKSLYIVFGLQAVLAWIIALPLVVAVRVPEALNLVDLVATLLWGVGFFFEVVGDWQLSRFRADPSNRGRVLDTGLWRYTRHPNYFGEACMWWAFWLFAAAAGGWWTIFSPLLMTVLLLRVSGVTLLEKDIRQRRPAYENYVRRTNAFLPGPPKEGDTQ